MGDSQQAKEVEMNVVGTSENVASEPNPDDIEYAIKLSQEMAGAAQAEAAKPTDTSATPEAIPMARPDTGDTAGSSIELQTMDSMVSSVEDAAPPQTATIVGTPVQPSPGYTSTVGRRDQEEEGVIGRVLANFSPEAKQNSMLGCCFLFLAIFIAMLVPSFFYVGYDEIALKKNSVSNKINLEDVYEPGRYFWGFWCDKVAFSTIYKFVDFNRGNELSVFDKNGLTVELHSSFQYRIVQKDLGKLFDRYGYDFHPQVVAIARMELKNQLAKRYEARDFFMRRREVTLEIEKLLDEKLKADMFVTIPSGKFQLREVILPDITVKSYLNVILAAEQNEVRNTTIEASQIRAQTDLNVEREYNSARYIIEQRAKAKADAIIRAARAEADRILLNATARGHRSIRDKLDLDPDAQFAKFLRLENVASDTVIVSGGDPSQLEFLYGSSWNDGKKRRRSHHQVDADLIHAAMAAGASP
jgi:regulator of protease activity HflC (stomatin/prohibitin superfamily)